MGAHYLENKARTMQVILCLALFLSGCHLGQSVPTQEAATPASGYLPPTIPPEPTTTISEVPTSQLVPPPKGVLGHEAMREVLISTYDDSASNEWIITFFDTYDIVNCVDKDVTGEGIQDRVCEPSMGFETSYYELYADVDGDGAAELIVAIDNGLFVLERQQDRYQRISVVGVGYSRFPPRVSVKLEDWTGDGRADIVFDVATTDGGTMLYGKAVSRTILTCRSDNCVTSWADTIASYRDEDTIGGFHRGEMQMVLVPAVGNSPTMLRAHWSSYSVHCCTYGEGIDVEHPITVFTETETLYSLNVLGEFEKSAERVLSPMKYPDFPVAYDALDTRGNRAVLEWIEWRPNDFCRIVLNGIPIGTPFGCLHKLTSIMWRDVDSDGKEDLVVVAYEPDNMEVKLEWGKANEESEWAFPLSSCVAQRLMVYSLQAEVTRIVADVRGCIVDPITLYGARFEDVDGDGQVEITAVIGGTENGTQSGTAVYRWSGESFALVEEARP